MKSLILMSMYCLGFGDYPPTNTIVPGQQSKAATSLLLVTAGGSPAGTMVPTQSRPLTYLPNGPYRSGNTRNFKIMLTGQCENSAGQYVNASMDLTRLTNMNNYLVNENGVLKSAGGKNEQPTTFTPVGTYRQTCKVLGVTLTAEAKKDNGQFVPASINIMDMPVDTQIQNIDGVLSTVKK